MKGYYTGVYCFPLKLRRADLRRVMTVEFVFLGWTDISVCSGFATEGGGELLAPMFLLCRGGERIPLLDCTDPEDDSLSEDDSL